MEREKLEEEKLMNAVKTGVLVLSMAALLAFSGYLLADMIGFIIALVLTLGYFLFSPAITPENVMRLYRGRPISYREAPGLYQIQEELAERAGLNYVPVLYHIPAEEMNAFAVGSREHSGVGLTAGLLGRLNLRELRGVLAHEMSHIAGGDLRIMSLAASMNRLTDLLSRIGKFSLILLLPLALLGGVKLSLGIFLLFMILPVISGLLQLGLSRTREFAADRNAAELTGDPTGLVSALRKLNNSNRGLMELLFPGNQQGASLLRSHPALKDRVERLLGYGAGAGSMARPVQGYFLNP